MLVEDFADWLYPQPIYLLLLAAVAGWRSAGRARAAFWSVAVAGYLMLMPATGNVMLGALEQRYPPADAVHVEPGAMIAVLSSGTAWPQGGRWIARLNRDGWERTDCAVQLWRRTRGRMYFLGHPVGSGGESVAARMAQVAVALGADQDDVMVEGRSRNTYENIEALTRMVGHDSGRLYLVTSAYHMPRAMAVARAMGIQAVPFSCAGRSTGYFGWRAWVPNVGSQSRLRVALHEYIGLIMYRVKGWAAAD